MTPKYYNQPVEKERLDRYKQAFQHLNLLKTTPTSQARAGSSFLVQKQIGTRINTHFPSGNSPEIPPHPDEQPLPLPETYAELDSYIDNCIHEYFTWLAQTELRRAKLTLPLTDSYRPTDFSPLLDKEATP